MKLNIKIETEKEVWNDILCTIIGFAASCDAKTLEIEGLDTCEPFFTDEEIADIIKEATRKRNVNRINKISLK